MKLLVPAARTYTYTHTYVHTLSSQIWCFVKCKQHILQTIYRNTATGLTYQTCIHNFGDFFRFLSLTLSIILVLVLLAFCYWPHTFMQECPNGKTYNGINLENSLFPLLTLDVRDSIVLYVCFLVFSPVENSNSKHSMLFKFANKQVKQ